MRTPKLTLEVQLELLLKERDALLAQVKELRRRKGAKQMLAIFTAVGR
jgi:hypothetical protein